jgi:hypothetical protein
MPDLSKGASKAFLAVKPLHPSCYESDGSPCDCSSYRWIPLAVYSAQLCDWRAPKDINSGGNPSRGSD